MLSAHQDAVLATGKQETYSQSQIGRAVGLTRARVEHLELTARLRFIKTLAQSYPQSFLDLGGTYEQLSFLKSIRISAANSRRLWRRWSSIGRGIHERRTSP